nr:MAG: EamA-like transporter family protein [Chloroflexota bacterium]
MIEALTIIVIGLIGGAAVGLQGPIVSAMGQIVGPAAGSFIVHVSGAVFAGLLLFARGGENMAHWRSLPWYMLLSGIFGVVLYLTLNQTMPRFGALTALMLIIAGQITVGVVIDHFGWFGVAQRPIDGVRVLALGLMLLSIYLINR